MFAEISNASGSFMNDEKFEKMFQINKLPMNSMQI